MATAQKRGFRLPWGSDPRRDEPSTDDQANGASSDARTRSSELGSGPFGVAGTADSSTARAATQSLGGTTERAATTDPDAAPILRRDAWPANDRRTAGPLSGDRPLASLARAAAAASAIAAGAAATTVSDATAKAPRTADVAVETPTEFEAPTELEAPSELEAATDVGGSTDLEAATDPEGSTDLVAPADPDHAEAEVTDGSDDDQVEVVSDARIQALTGEAPTTEAPTTEAMAMPTVEVEAEAETSAHSTGLPEDAGAEVARTTAPPAAAMTGGVRRDNPLVAGLVRAMRQAAAAARDEVLATFRVDAEGRAESLKAESTSTTESLRKAADADIAAIKDWSRAELARVREETEARIADRKTRLVEETEFEATDLQERLTDLKATVEGFETDMAAFFEMLLAEGDPARLAGLAERMPSPPAIGGRPGAESESVASAEVEPAWSQESESVPSAEIDEAAAEAAPAVVEASAAEDAPVAQETPAAEDAPVAHEAPSGEAQRIDEPAAFALTWPGDEPAPAASTSGDHLDPDAAAAAEAEARVGLDVQTHVVVSGLSSVASIAAFKAALVHGTGVSAVSVTAGTDGEVLYTVTHDGRVDFRQVFDSMAAFEARIVSDDGTTLSVAAREPAA